MRGDEIIDVDVDPREARQDFWRRLARFGIPLAAVLLIVAAILALTLYSYRTNRNDALELSENLIAVLDQQVQTEVESYLDPAARAVRTLAGMLPDQGLSPATRPGIEELAMQLLRDRAQLAAVYVGDPQGDFLMVQRSPGGALDTKIIAHDGGQRRVTWHRRDPTGEAVAVEEDPADTFDPRTRPWYAGAASTEGLFWTDVYVFFTTRQPGVTVATAVHGPDGELRAVTGGDVTLAALSDFLSSLEIGATGRAMIVDAEGRLIAYPDPARVVETIAGEYQPAAIEAIGDPVLAEAYDRIRVAGDGRSMVEIDDRSYIVAGAALAEPAARDWRLLLVVPEDDFVGFVAVNSRKTLLLSSGIVAMAICLAGLLAYQGLVADRNARALVRRERALTAQTAAFDELAATAARLDPGDQEALRRLTETVARAVAARRVSVWQLDDAHGEVVCSDCYDQESKGHTAGAAIRRVEAPELLEALAKGDEIAVADAAEDPRTRGLARTYLSAVGAQSLLSVPIVNQDPAWSAASGSRTPERSGPGDVDVRAFARTIARLMTARFAPPREPEAERPVVAVAGGGASARAAPVAARLIAPAPGLRTASISDERDRALLRKMSARGVDDDRRLATLYPQTTVLALRLFDDIALAAPHRCRAADRGHRADRRGAAGADPGSAGALRQDHDQRDRGGRGLRWRC